MRILNLTEVVQSIANAERLPVHVVAKSLGVTLPKPPPSPLYILNAAGSFRGATIELGEVWDWIVDNKGELSEEIFGDFVGPVWADYCNAKMRDMVYSGWDEDHGIPLSDSPIYGFLRQL